MNEQKLIQNVIEQIKEAQLKLGAEKEVIRLYFPMASMNAILGTNYTDEQEMLAALRTNTVFDTTVLGRLKFLSMKGDLRCVCLRKVRSMWQEKSRTRLFSKQ